MERKAAAMGGRMGGKSERTSRNTREVMKRVWEGEGENMRSRFR